jgi:rare lipoprotein A
MRATHVSAAQPAPPAAAPAPPPVSGSTPPVLTGVATWYGEDFQGQAMADGEPYNMNNPGICAANLYPLGTMLRVTRITTGQSIVVRVTDHGAFTYPDITDLSYAAFAQLADPASGVIGVQVEPLQ